MSSIINLGQSNPLGATLYPDGVNFSVFSKNATGMELLLFDEVSDSNPRVVALDPVKNRTYHYWHIAVPQLPHRQQFILNAGVDKVHRDIILGHSLQGMDVHYMAPSEDDLHRAMARYTEWLDGQLDLHGVDQNVDQDNKKG